ncbi:LysR family transcriptional regulator [Massilia sp. IC2-477]|uniref:LysR substrate-binding domain-containing protein n=1 Tax=Massilia sp. IC2-477 TaxID=2887198 RepID=UPI001D11A8C6|nr:LysR substrate-binding domain-containing protein [Massilia sp. IC2-477]MCC2956906.1 LysR family transcriptional regulator [Massilia sp. IC2-477]
MIASRKDSMDRFAELKTFCTVAAAGGFSAAARQLGVATSSVTRVIDALEERLGVALLNRSTRSVTLTEAGRGYQEDALRILEQLEAADDAVTERAGEVKGVLRVAAPPTFAALYIAPMLPDLRVRHPQLTLDLCLSNTVINLADESIDVAIRMGSVDPEARLVARRLAAHQRVLCASPAYLKRHGTPRTPQELANHDCLQFSFTENRRSWRLRRKDDPDAAVEEVPIRGVVQADNADVLRQAAVAGLGVAMLAHWLVHADLRAGRLLRVMEDYAVNPGPMDVAMHAVYQENRRGSQKIRAFVDLLAEHLGRAGIPEA